MSQVNLTVLHLHHPFGACANLSPPSSTGFCDFTKSRNDTIRESPARYNISTIEWIWIDTCCIDRRSSAEIAENITSMCASRQRDTRVRVVKYANLAFRYKYYEQSEECYAYLSDVSATEANYSLQEFQKSSWFRQGWTLQELLAPSRVIFISQEWEVFGHKCSEYINSVLSISRTYRMWTGTTPRRCQETCCTWGNDILNSSISSTTGIPMSILNKSSDPRKLPPDRICQWIQHRETKKEEDLAYCLLRLLGIYMVTNYGEGDNAWSRLEEEVSKKRKHEYSLPRPSQLRPDAEQWDSPSLTEPLVISPRRARRRRHYSISSLPLSPTLSFSDDGPDVDLTQDSVTDRIITRYQIEHTRKEQEQEQVGHKFEEERAVRKWAEQQLLKEEMEIRVQEQRIKEEKEKEHYERWLIEKRKAEQEEPEGKREEQDQLIRAIVVEEHKLKEEMERQRKEREDYVERALARRPYNEASERPLGRRTLGGGTCSLGYRTTTNNTTAPRISLLSLPVNNVRTHDHWPARVDDWRYRTSTTRENAEQQLDSSRRRDRCLIASS